MELVYLVNGSASEGGGRDGRGGGSAGYPLVSAAVAGGAVQLRDGCVSCVELKTPDAVVVRVPPATEGVARDFLLRLVVTADVTPEVTFAASGGESLSFEEASDDVFAFGVGTSVFSFTETAAGVLLVSRRAVSGTGGE